MPIPPFRSLSFPRRLFLIVAAFGLTLGGAGFVSAQAPPAPAPAPVAVAVDVPDEDGLYGFEWKWVEGDVARYRMVSDTDATISGVMFPDGMETHMQQVVEATQEVVAVSPEGVATVRATYDSLAMTADMPGQGTINWSSQDPEVGDDPQMKAMAGAWGMLVGRPITMKIDRLGTVLEIEGMDELIQQVIEGFGEDEESRAAMRSMMAEIFNEETVQQLTQQGLLVFPGEPLTVGDAWTHELELTLPIVGALAQKQTHTFERLDGDEAVFLLDGSIALGGAGGDGALPGMPAQLAEMMDIAFETRLGEVEGTLRFDRRRGLLSRQEMTVRLEMTITMTPKGEMAETVDEPMVMDVATTAKTVYELIPSE